MGRGKGRKEKERGRERIGGEGRERKGREGKRSAAGGATVTKGLFHASKGFILEAVWSC